MMKQLYYKLTAYIPRPLPTSQKEYSELKAILNQYYGLEDHPQAWYTMASQLLAGKPTSMRRSYGSIANAVKKMKVAALVHIERELASQDLNRRLEEKAKETINAFKDEQREQDLQHASEIRPKWSDISPGAVSKSRPHHADLPTGPQHIQESVQAVQEPPERMV
jgi:hypothetical protein